MAIGIGAAQPDPMARTTHKPTAGNSLCGNCMHQTNCIFRRQAVAPVVHCELHESIVPRMNGTHQAWTPPTPTMATGLCATCDHRTHCTLRDPERMVMHCEQYE